MSSLHHSSLIAAAVGATIGVISVATVMIYNKIMEQNQHTTMNSNIDRVNRKVLELQSELEELRAQQALLQQKNRKKRIAKRQITYTNDNNSTYSATDDVDIDTYSTAGTDFGDDEFYDCSDDEISAIAEDGVGDVKNGTVPAMNEDSELLELDADNEKESMHPVLYHKLKNLVFENPNDVEIVWRFARACYNMSSQSQDSERQKEFIFEGCEACEKILHMRHGNLYKWYAIIVGLKSQHLPTKGKIQNGHLFKEYVEKALEIFPNDSSLHHLMGRFKYEVSTLSWIERKVASTLFAEVPTATYEDAITFFEAAEKLSDKPLLENKLYLAKCYIAINNYQEAIKWLQRAKELPAISEEEIKIQSEVEHLLGKYSRRRT